MEILLLEEDEGILCNNRNLYYSYINDYFFAEIPMKLFGWKPPQRPEWVKVIMKTPVPIRVQLALLTVLTLSSFTSTMVLLTRKESKPKIPVIRTSAIVEFNKPGAKLILQDNRGIERLVELYQSYETKLD